MAGGKPPTRSLSVWTIGQQIGLSMARLEVCAQTQALRPWLQGSAVWDAGCMPSTRKRKHGV
jgi:hypothetical protein